MRSPEPSFSTDKGECRIVRMPSSSNAPRDSTWSWQPSSYGIPWSWHEPLRSCEAKEWTGYVSLVNASTTTAIKARAHFKCFCGHFMDDQFGQELFPGTSSSVPAKELPNFVGKTGDYP